MSSSFPMAHPVRRRSRGLVEARVLLKQGNDDALRGKPSAAIARYEEGLGLLEGQRHPVAADLLFRLATVRTDLGQTGAGDELFGQSLEMATSCDYVAGQAYAANSLGAVAQRRGELDLAEWQYRRAARLATQAGDHRFCGKVERNLGTLANIRGDLDGAWIHHGKSLSAFGRAADTEEVCRALNELGMVEIDLRRYRQAAATLDRALELARHRRDPIMIGLLELNRVEALIGVASWREAEAGCERAMVIADELGDALLRAEALKLLSVIHRDTSRLDRAREALGEAHDLARRGHDRLLAAEIVAEQGEIQLRSGQPSEARALWTLALAEFQALDAVIDVVQLRRKLQAVAGST